MIHGRLFFLRSLHHHLLPLLLLHMEPWPYTHPLPQDGEQRRWNGTVLGKFHMGPCCCCQGGMQDTEHCSRTAQIGVAQQWALECLTDSLDMACGQHDDQRDHMMTHRRPHDGDYDYWKGPSSCQWKECVQGKRDDVDGARFSPTRDHGKWQITFPCRSR